MNWKSEWVAKILKHIFITKCFWQRFIDAILEAHQEVLRWLEIVQNKNDLNVQTKLHNTTTKLILTKLSTLILKNDFSLTFPPDIVSYTSKTFVSWSLSAYQYQIQNNAPKGMYETSLNILIVGPAAFSFHCV